MTKQIVHSLEPVTLLGGGAAQIEDVTLAMGLAPLCVAADGGAELARRAGVDLTAVIGDFDSVSAETVQLIPQERRFHISEQDSTDFDKALRHITAPVILGVGFTGARIDHQLAALNVMARYPDRPCVLIGPDEVMFLCPPQISVPCDAGETVSLYPLAPVMGTSRGLHWPIDGLAFDPLTRIGTSNRALGDISLTMEAPAMIVILPRGRLAAVIQALVSAPPSARWSVPAERCTAQPQS
ncbi:thiamine diphosphokinase [Tateyamaria sp. SN3-11]|uniref:thiamine diphosphokinase n=1 Tax=Tateyamaria sp. SN3-11 TaxID=3092147 RepID=UPI0039ED8935